MSLVKTSSAVNSTQDQADLYCRLCQKHYPDEYRYRRHLYRTVRHMKLEQQRARSAIELTTGVSDGVYKDALHTPSSPNSQEQDEFDIEESSNTSAPVLPANVVPLPAPRTERVFDVALSTSSSATNVRRKRGRPHSTPIVERTSEPSAGRRRTTNASVNNNVDLAWQKVCDNVIATFQRTKRDMSTRVSAVVERIENASDRNSLLQLHRTIVELDNAHTTLQNEIAASVRNVQELFDRASDTMQTAYAVLGRNITTLVEIPTVATATASTALPPTLDAHSLDTQLDNVPQPPPPPSQQRIADSEININV